MPITPFIGVRISWLMLARNADFMFDASTAWSRAIASSALARLRSVTSWQSATRQRARPAQSSLVISTSISVPSLSWWRHARPDVARRRRLHGGRVRAEEGDERVGVRGRAGILRGLRLELVARIAVGVEEGGVGGAILRGCLRVDEQRQWVAIEQQAVLRLACAQFLVEPDQPCLQLGPLALLEAMALGLA